MDEQEIDRMARAVQRAHSNAISGAVVWAVIIIALAAVGGLLLLAHVTTP